MKIESIVNEIERKIADKKSISTYEADLLNAYKGGAEIVLFTSYPTMSSSMPFGFVKWGNAFKDNRPTVEYAAYWRFNDSRDIVKHSK